MLTSLAYLGLTSPAYEEWPEFGAEVLGCQVAPEGPDGAVRLRIDDAPWRLQIHPGPSDDVAYIGWTVGSEEELAGVAEALVQHGIQPNVGDSELALSRCSSDLVWFMDPWGLRHEVVYALESDPRTFTPGRQISGFVTGSQGLGHVVLVLPDLEAAHQFFTEVLGFRLSDIVRRPENRRVHFYHCNGRHHSLAITSGSGRVGMDHLMLEVQHVDDVGSAYDIVRDRGLPIRKGLGRHTNDRMLSFYVTSPSRLHIEYGSSPVTVDEDWIPRTYMQPSIWGHRVPGGGAPPPGIVR